MSSLLSRSIDECAEDDPMVSPPGGSAPEPNFDWPDDDFGLEMVDRDGLVTEAAEAADAMVETAEASPRQPRPDIGRSAWRQSMWKLAVVVAVLIAFYLLPLAGQIKGAVIGAVVALVIHRLFTHIFAPSQPKKPIPVAPLKELPPMLKPEVLFLNVKQGVGEIYKGWMNELLCDYSIDGHHINQTFSVYVRLEGYNLRLSRPKTNIPHRMMFDEQRHDPIFVHQRHFDLTGSKVFLLPPGLVSKRLWSKKYPICIALARTGSKRTVKPPIETNLEEEPEQSLGGEVPRREECSESILYLFARTCREKEEWFRRFQMTILYADLAALSSKERPVSRTPSLSSISSSSSMKDVASERKEQQQQPHGSSDVEKPSEIEMSSVAQRMGHRKTASDGDVSPLSSPTHEHETTAGSWFAEAENLLDGTGSKPGEEVPVELLHRRSESEPNFASFDEEKSPPSVARQELEKGELSETASYPRLADASEGGTQGHNERRVKSSQVAPQSPVRSRVSANTAQQLQFNNYMARLIPSDKQAATNADCQDSVAWLNALLGRLFWDFLRENLWAEKVAEKIQKKLSMIKVPYFIDELTLTDIELGVSLPVMRRASLPWVDDRGLWVDLEVAYSGSFKMTLSTKVNLMKLKKDPEMAGSDSDETDKARRDLSAVTDSDVEDSAESSSDEESQAPEDAVVKNLDENSQNPIIIGGASVQKKFLRMVDKITASRYFQQATEYKYIKKAMENVSKVPLLLTVEVHSLTGTMALNVPPPPTDRLWMGFRNNPLISISARPKLGARLVNIEYVTDWIEKKLVLELQRVLVMPNMDDLEIPIMQGNVNVPRRPDL
ncbi:PREDICTED: testis-expressed sequence 2 protein-like [Priapulus caudatus]|uniref:Testis-expressed sequence 2 protein-like n=1 Tax=Priapulus caudatus TaxID=37621 RepID=A0ABM1DXB5_PRICU|nr:PREDICTED: testis-expressed sequence 2 protein-like [Priapulus caudatus]